MDKAYLTEGEVAKTLGRSRDWLRKNRDRLEREGFPAVDGLIGLTCVDDINAWIARRRKVADAVAADNHPLHHIEPQGIDYAKL